MSFTSLNFVIFFLVVLVLVRGVLSSWESRKTLLLAASYFFYMSWDWRFGGLLLLLTGINFVCGRLLHAAPTTLQKRLYLTVALTSSLGVLAYFKYANFFIDSFAALLTGLGMQANLPLLSVVLPVGISFYTFQSITYALDIYRGRLQPVDTPDHLVHRAETELRHVLPELLGQELLVGQGVEERRLADAGEPDQGDGGVAGLLDGVAVAPAATGLLLELLLLLGELGLQPADVLLGGLVVGRVPDLLAEGVDLLL